jgi:hypothetical protein
MASDQTEVTAVPSVPAGSVRRACSYRRRHAWLGSTLLVPSGGQDGGEVMHLSGAVWLRREEGVVADPDLSVRPDSLGLARP